MARSPETCKVIPLLIGIEAHELSGPLALFQAQKLGRPGLYKVVHSLQGSADQPIPENLVRRLFDVLWPEFEKKLRSPGKELP